MLYFITDVDLYRSFKLKVPLTVHNQLAKKRAVQIRVSLTHYDRDIKAFLEYSHKFYNNFAEEELSSVKVAR